MGEKKGINGCIFCKIINGDLPAAKIYEDEYVIAFLDINPLAPKGGHTLVVPREHAETIDKLSETSLQKTALAVKKISQALLEISEGLNIIQNNRRIAGQLVPHVHFHLIPRTNGDNLKITEGHAHQLSASEMDAMKEKIKTLLNK